MSKSESSRPLVMSLPSSSLIHATGFESLHAPYVQPCELNLMSHIIEIGDV